MDTESEVQGALGEERERERERAGEHTSQEVTTDGSVGLPGEVRQSAGLAVVPSVSERKGS